MLAEPLTEPAPGFPENCHEDAVAVKPNGTVPVAVINRPLGLGKDQIYRHDHSPLQTRWRMLGQGSTASAR